MQPTFETFCSTFNNGVMMQYTIGLNAVESVAGLVTAYNPDLRNRYCYVSGYCDRTLIGTGVALEAIIFFVNHVFQCWDFEKVYAEVAASTIIRGQAEKVHCSPSRERLKITCISKGGDGTSHPGNLSEPGGSRMENASSDPEYSPTNGLGIHCASRSSSKETERRGDDYSLIF